MIKYYTNNFNDLNLYKKMSKNSEIVTQIIFGQSFSVIKKTSKWLKIKIKEDKYTGFIKKKKFSNYIRPTHKICVLNAKTYKESKKKINLGELTFGSKIKINTKLSKIARFENRWIETKNFKPINYKSNNIFKKVHLFKNIKYKWGGKTGKGIDCSALVQIFLNFNNKFCPRDAKDQLKYFKKDINLKKIKKNDIIYWKGHVAIAISKKKLIHAYGPMKKTIVMNIDQTIKLIKRTAKLNVISVKRI